MHSSLVLALALAAVPLSVGQGVSKSSRCGPDFGLTCQGSRYGNCCSQYSYCGSTDAYCGVGCQRGWGSCNTSVSSSAKASSVSSTKRTSSTIGASSSPSRSPSTIPKSSASSTRVASAAPSSTLKLSSNARCGYAYDASPGGMSCLGSKWGNCCSQFSYCGTTEAYCGAGCQEKFGECNPASSSAAKSSTRSSYSSSAVLSTVSTSRLATTTKTSSSSTIRSTSRSLTQSTSSFIVQSPAVSTSSTSIASASSTMSTLSASSTSISSTTSTSLSTFSPIMASSATSVSSLSGSTDSSILPTSTTTLLSTLLSQTTLPPQVSTSAAISSPASSSETSSLSTLLSSTFLSSSTSESLPSSSTSESLPSSSTSSSMLQTPSATPSSLPAPSCINALQNPQFANGDLTGWDESIGGFATRSGVVQTPGQGHGDDAYYSWTAVGQPNDGFFAGVSLFQFRVNIPSGSTVDCTGFSRITRTKAQYYSGFRIFIDNVRCASIVILGATEWQQLTSEPITVNGDEHTITIDMSTPGFGADEEIVMDLDDLAITYASPPGTIISCTGSGNSNLIGDSQK